MKSQNTSEFSFPLFYVYMLECGDGSLYTGYTPDLFARLKKHKDKKGARYTKSRAPVSLVYFEVFTNEHDARSREWHLKRMPRSFKLDQIRSFRYCPVFLQQNFQPEPAADLPQ